MVPENPITAPRRKLLGATAGAMLFAGRPAEASRPAPAVRLNADPTIADHGEVIQAAVIALELAGGGVIQLSPGVYHCRSGGITLDPTKTSLIGEKSILDFSEIGPTPKDTGALMLTVPPSSTQYGQATQRIEGIALRGPGVATDLAGLLFVTETPAFSSRITLYNLDISGFADGIRFGDRAYLIQAYSIGVGSCGNCLKVLPNLADAGENISFYGSTFGNSARAICNTGGFEFNFFGCSFDYVEQWYQGAGFVSFFGCHFEKQRPVAADPLFDVQGRGQLNFNGGWIMVSGVDFDPNPKNASVFNLEFPASRVTLNDVLVYNLRSSGGVLASGLGRLVINHLLGGTNKRIDPVPMAGAAADLFGGMGSFAGSEILIDADLVSDAADTARNAAHYGTLALKDGALAVNKTGGVGNGLTLRLFCPISAGRLPSVVFDWQVTGGSGTVWVQLLAVQKIGQDALGRTKAGASTPVGPLGTLNAGGGGWSTLTLNALNMTWDFTDDGATPEWVTHLCVAVNLIELAADAQFQIRNLRSYSF